MANGNLERRVTNLEKNTDGGKSQVEIYLRDWCSPEMREILRGHEAELTGRVFADGTLTFEGLQVIHGCLPPEVQRPRVT